MSLRSRPSLPADHPAMVWSDTIHDLAEVHRSRREIIAANRWPLAHDCSRRNGAAVRSADEDAGADLAPADRALCCRALA